MLGCGRRRRISRNASLVTGHFLPMGTVFASLILICVWSPFLFHRYCRVPTPPIPLLRACSKAVHVSLLRKLDLFPPHEKLKLLLFKGPYGINCPMFHCGSIFVSYFIRYKIAPCFGLASSLHLFPFIVELNITTPTRILGMS
jgi:hypothetical protein